MDSAHDNPEGLGCPIRTSSDQSLLAAPRGLSQRATSFIASQCQGIHQMPFSHTIQPAQSELTIQTRSQDAGSSTQGRRIQLTPCGRIADPGPHGPRRRPSPRQRRGKTVKLGFSIPLHPALASEGPTSGDLKTLAIGDARARTGSLLHFLSRRRWRFPLHDVQQHGRTPKGARQSLPECSDPPPGRSLQGLFSPGSPSANPCDVPSKRRREAGSSTGRGPAMPARKCGTGGRPSQISDPRGTVGNSRH